MAGKVYQQTNVIRKMDLNSLAKIAFSSIVMLYLDILLQRTQTHGMSIRGFKHGHELIGCRRPHRLPFRKSDRKIVRRSASDGK